MPLRLAHLLFLLVMLAGCAGDPFADYTPIGTGVEAGPPPQGAGVVHTDRSGARLTAYDPARSFFPLALGGALVDYNRGVARGFTQAFLADFNAVAADPEQPLEAQLNAADGSRLMLLRARPDNWGDLRHAALLDASAVAVIAMPRGPKGFDPGAADAFSRSARRQADRPVWALLPASARTGNGESLPLPAEARVMAYAALAAGATGLIWQGEDNYASRNAGWLGIAPAPQIDYGIQIDSRIPPLLATPDDVAASRRLWEAVTQLNRRIARIAPALLQPDIAMGAETGYSLAVRSEENRAAPPRLRSLMKPFENGVLLIVVNLGARAEDIRVAVSRSLRGVTHLEEGDPLPLDAARGLFRDSIAAQDVRLYRITLQ